MSLIVFFSSEYLIDLWIYTIEHLNLEYVILNKYQYFTITVC